MIVTFHGYSFSIAAFASLLVIPFKEIPFTLISDAWNVDSSMALASVSFPWLFPPEKIRITPAISTMQITALPIMIRRLIMRFLFLRCARIHAGECWR